MDIVGFRKNINVSVKTKPVFPYVPGCINAVRVDNLPESDRWFLVIPLSYFQRILAGDLKELLQES